MFRQAFATPLLEDGDDLRTVEELLGPARVGTTLIDPHVLNRGGRGERRPLDGRGGAREGSRRVTPLGGG